MKRLVGVVLALALTLSAPVVMTGCSSTAKADDAKAYLSKVNPIYVKADIALEVARKGFDASFFSATSDANSMKQEATRVKSDLEKAKADFDKAKSDFDAVTESTTGSEDLAKQMSDYFESGDAYFKEIAAAINYVLASSTISEKMDITLTKADSAPADDPVPTYQAVDAEFEKELAEMKAIAPPASYKAFHDNQVASLEKFLALSKQSTIDAAGEDEAVLNASNAAIETFATQAQATEDADLKAIQSGSLSTMRKKTIDLKAAVDAAISKLKQDYDIKL